MKSRCFVFVAIAVCTLSTPTLSQNVRPGSGAFVNTGSGTSIICDSILDGFSNAMEGFRRNKETYQLIVSEDGFAAKYKHSRLIDYVTGIKTPKRYEEHKRGWFDNYNFSVELKSATYDTVDIYLSNYNNIMNFITLDGLTDPDKKEFVSRALREIIKFAYSDAFYIGRSAALNQYIWCRESAKQQAEIRALKKKLGQK